MAESKTEKGEEPTGCHNNMRLLNGFPSQPLGDSLGKSDGLFGGGSW